MYPAAMWAFDFQRCLPEGLQALRIGLDASGGLLVRGWTGEEQRRHARPPVRNRREHNHLSATDAWRRAAPGGAHQPLNRNIVPKRSERELSGTRRSWQSVASGERLQGGLARRLEAMRTIVPFIEGKIDRPYPGPAMVSKRAEQSDPAYDLSVRDHLVLSGISCRLHE